MAEFDFFCALETFLLVIVGIIKKDKFETFCILTGCQIWPSTGNKSEHS